MSPEVQHFLSLLAHAKRSRDETQATLHELFADANVVDDPAMLGRFVRWADAERAWLVENPSDPCYDDLWQPYSNWVFSLGSAADAMRKGSELFQLQALLDKANQWNRAFDAEVDAIADRNPCGGATTQAPATHAPEQTPACEPAPEWIVRFLQSVIAIPGAKLGKTYVVPATNLDGPPIFTSLSDEFSEHAWWVGSRINGGGVDDEAATWVTSSLDDPHPVIFPVSDAAGRYSTYTVPIAITGDGQDMLLGCLG